MRVNVCINGSFRYPDYIRFYEEAGVLNAFYFAHHRATTASRLGLREEATHNIWVKQYLLRAAFHLAPRVAAPALSTAVCDLWQRAVIRHWRPCDSLETVIGAVSDQVIAFAKTRGTRVLGHPVTTHPSTVEALVGRAYESLGLDHKRARVPDRSRRLDEIAACDGFIADSSLVARSFIEHGVPPSRISVVRPSLDRARFVARAMGDVDRDMFHVVCVGIITPRKGQHLLLDAWRRLKLPRARLTLVGALGRDAGAVLRGYGDCFTHIAHIDQAKLRALLVRASVCVMPSAEDGFAQAPFEAMACGVPPIVTDHVGMAEMIRHGVDGFVVPPYDPEAIAAAIETLYLDRDRADEMGQAASATVHGAGSWADYTARVIALHRILDAKASARSREAA